MIIARGWNLVRLIVSWRHRTVASTMSGLDRLLTGEDEYVNIVVPTDHLLRVKAREPIDEAVGKLFRYCGEDHGVASG